MSCHMSLYQSQLPYLMTQVRPYYHLYISITSDLFLGDMRICKSKADLKKITRVEVSARNVDRKDCTVLDGCAILWCIAWPTSSPTNQALVKDFVDFFKKYLQRQLSWGDGYLVFYRYIEFSTKYSDASPGILVAAEYYSCLPMVLFLLRNKFSLSLKTRSG